MRLKQKLAAALLHRLGWTIRGTLPEEPKYIVAIVPHTSWIDFIIGVLVRSALDADIKYLAKKSLFHPLWGWFFRWMGGYPVDRSRSIGLVRQVGEIYRSKEHFAIALAPEGTRKKVSELKTGFYYMARQADVPIVLARMDYGTKTLSISEPIWPKKEQQKDFKRIYRFFKGAEGKRPEKSFDP